MDDQGICTPLSDRNSTAALHPRSVSNLTSRSAVSTALDQATTAIREAANFLSVAAKHSFNEEDSARFRELARIISPLAHLTNSWSQMVGEVQQ
jgi:hypothetical protein